MRARRGALWLAAACAACAAGGLLGACGAAESSPTGAAAPSALPSDLAGAVQPFSAAIGTSHNALAGAQARENSAIAAGDLAALRGAVAAELGAVRGLEAALQNVPFPADLRGDEVTHMLRALQQAETWLATAGAATPVAAVQSALGVAREDEQRAYLSETLVARFLGFTPPPAP